MPRIKTKRTRSQQRTYKKNVGPKGSPQRAQYRKNKRNAGFLQKLIGG